MCRRHLCRLNSRVSLRLVVNPQLIKCELVWFSVRNRVRRCCARQEVVMLFGLGQCRIRLAWCYGMQLMEVSSSRSEKLNLHLVLVIKEFLICKNSLKCSMHRQNGVAWIVAWGDYFHYFKIWFYIYMLYLYMYIFYIYIKIHNLNSFLKECSLSVIKFYLHFCGTYCCGSLRISLRC